MGAGVRSLLAFWIGGAATAASGVVNLHPASIPSTSVVGTPRALYDVPLVSDATLATRGILQLICQQRYFDCTVYFRYGREDHIFGESRELLLKIAERMTQLGFYNAWFSYYQNHQTLTLSVTLDDVQYAYVMYPFWVLLPDPYANNFGA